MTHDERDPREEEDRDREPEARPTPLWKLGVQLFVSSQIPVWAAKLFDWIRHAHPDEIEGIAVQLSPRDGDTLRAIVRTVKEGK